MIVVDTNVWSELTRPNPSPIVRRWEAEHADELWISTIVLAELRGGSGLMPEGHRRSTLLEQIEAIAEIYADRILPFGEAETRSYAAVLISAKQAGKPVMSADAMIAATAHAQGMAVATRDVAGFAGTGISLINPWDA
jgi:predicted nucleic acid-binding protein